MQFEVDGAPFSKHFSTLKDHRQNWKVEHLFFDILFLSVTAVIGGAQGWDEIRDFGELRLDWLKKYGSFQNGIPSRDTIARVISRIDPEELEKCFINWMQESVELTKGSIIAVDGKVIKNSACNMKEKSAIHMVSAFSTEYGEVLGQVKADDKSNEITAIPELLSILEIAGCLITIDAIGCQTKIARKIVGKNADYLLAVKGNQGRLHNAFKDLLGPAEIQKMDFKTLDYYETDDDAHGRIELRQHMVFDPFKDFDDLKGEWPGLKKLGVVISWRREKSEEYASANVRYYISSEDLTAERFAKAVRGHWQIENCLHWMLDVGMREDDCKIHRDDGAQILSGIRKIAQNLLKRDTSKKAGIQRKQKMAAMDEDYMSRVLEG